MPHSLAKGLSFENENRRRLTLVGEYGSRDKKQIYTLKLSSENMGGRIS